MSARRTAEMQALLERWREAVPDDRLAHLAKDATRALVRALQMRLAQHNVSFGHWSFLRILWESDGLTQRELSELAGVMEPTTFAALKTMESLGYVTRRQTPGDRRRIFIDLTPLGRSLKERLVPLAIDVNDIAVKGLSAADIELTRRTLRAILSNLARDAIEGAQSGLRVPPTRRRQAP